MIYLQVSKQPFSSLDFPQELQIIVTLNFTLWFTFYICSLCLMLSLPKCKRRYGKQCQLEETMAPIKLTKTTISLV